MPTCTHRPAPVGAPSDRPSRPGRCPRPASPAQIDSSATRSHTGSCGTPSRRPRRARSGTVAYRSRLCCRSEPSLGLAPAHDREACPSRRPRPRSSVGRPRARSSLISAQSSPRVSSLEAGGPDHRHGAGGDGRGRLEVGDPGDHPDAGVRAGAVDAVSGGQHDPGRGQRPAAAHREPDHPGESAGRDLVAADHLADRLGARRRRAPASRRPTAARRRCRGRQAKPTFRTMWTFDHSAHRQRGYAPSAYPLL